MTRQTNGRGARGVGAFALFVVGASIAHAGDGGTKSKAAPAPPAPPAPYAPPPKAAPAPKFAPTPKPSAPAGSSSVPASSPAIADRHVQRPFGTVGEGRPFGSVGEDRPFGTVGEGRPFGSSGEGRPFGTVGEGRPFGSVGAPTPGAPDDGTPPPGSPPSSPRRLVPNPYVVLPPPSSLTVEVPVAPVAGSSSAEPGPPLAVDAAPGAFDPASLDAPWSLEPTEAEIRLATALAERGRDQLASGAEHLAEVTLEGAVQMFPLAPVLRLDHAFALLGAGFAHAASVELLRGLTLDPDLVDRTLNVVAPFGSRERFDAALEVAEGYRTAYPLDSHGRFLRGFLALHLGDVERAREEFDAIVRADPEFPLAKTFRSLAQHRSWAALAPAPPEPVLPEAAAEVLPAEEASVHEETADEDPAGGGPPGP